MTRTQTLCLLPALACLVLASVPRTARAFQCESNLMIVLDRSCTMRDPPAGSSGKTKWEIALDVLDEVLMSHATDVDFGLILFPEPRDGHHECDQIDSIPVTVGPDHVRRIRRLLHDTPVGGPCVTNIDAAMDQVRDDPAYGADATNAKRGYVLLITDGRQSGTCGSDAGDERTLRTIEELYAAGYATYVVGFAGRSDDVRLDQFAVAGGVPRTGAAQSFYYASSEAELREALAAITGFVAADSEFGPLCEGVPCPDGRCFGEGLSCVDGACVPTPGAMGEDPSGPSLGGRPDASAALFDGGATSGGSEATSGPERSARPGAVSPSGGCACSVPTHGAPLGALPALASLVGVVALLRRRLSPNRAR